MDIKYYAVLTKYGFVQRVEEDYTDLIEDHPLVNLYNVIFTDNPMSAERFTDCDDEAPKYASGSKAPWDMTVEEWCKDIGGELVLIIEEHFQYVEYGYNSTYYETGKKATVTKDMRNYSFELFPYEEVEDKTEY